MTNVMATYQAARAWLARCVWISALLVCMCQRMAALRARRVWSTWIASVGWPPAVGQQFLDSAVRQRGQPHEHVCEVGPRVSPVELGRLQQAHRHGSSFTRQLAADEQPRLSSHGPRPDLVFEVVVVDGHLAV